VCRFPEASPSWSRRSHRSKAVIGFHLFCQEAGNFSSTSREQKTPEAFTLATLDSSEVKRLVGTDVAGAYMAGSLLYLKQGALVAQPLDLSREELNGDPVTIADPVGFDSTFNVGAFSVSPAGVVAYRTIAAGIASTRVVRPVWQGARRHGCSGRERAHLS
jgi:hypothetical protein